MGTYVRSVEVMENGDLRRLMEFIKVFFKWAISYGEVIKEIGEVEKALGKSFEQLSDELTSTEVMEMLSSRVPPDLVARFFALMMEVSKLMATDIRRLSPDDKVRVGERLIKASKELRRLVLEEIPKYLTVERGRASAEGG